MLLAAAHTPEVIAFETGHTATRTQKRPALAQKACVDRSKKKGHGLRLVCAPGVRKAARSHRRHVEVIARHEERLERFHERGVVMPPQRFRGSLNAVVRRARRPHVHRHVRLHERFQGGEHRADFPLRHETQHRERVPEKRPYACLETDGRLRSLEVERLERPCDAVRLHGAALEGPLDRVTVRSANGRERCLEAYLHAEERKRRAEAHAVIVGRAIEFHRRKTGGAIQTIGVRSGFPHARERLVQLAREGKRDLSAFEGVEGEDVLGRPHGARVPRDQAG